jgi:hypothetical protein
MILLLLLLFWFLIILFSLRVNIFVSTVEIVKLYCKAVLDIWCNGFWRDVSDVVIFAWTSVKEKFCKNGLHDLHYWLLDPRENSFIQFRHSYTVQNIAETHNMSYHRLFIEQVSSYLAYVEPNYCNRRPSTHYLIYYSLPFQRCELC